MRSSGIVVVLFVGATLSAVSCSGEDTASGPCSKNGNCPNSGPPTASQSSTCRNAFADQKCGNLFATYFDCALAQEKCTSAGVTDEDATRIAITANCAEETSAYSDCRGVPMQGTQCGLGGQICCTDGSPPCASTGCCDPSTQKCVGEGAACSGKLTVCSANQCGPCGAPGEPCCQIAGSTQQEPCPSGGCCNYARGQAGGMCIAEGGMCDAPGPNSTETVCNNGGCTTCGGELSLCCAGGKCSDPNDHCDGKTCIP